MESRTVLVGPFSGEKQSTAPQLGDLDFGDKLSAPLRDRGIELERLGDAWRELECGELPPFYRGGLSRAGGGYTSDNVTIFS
ncbi:hypothetical protein WJX75_000121 [Coccomyxa subellipsoidea]|uniref:Uncharacterized protein n=1 Tax=Coccomyxa subellipsoidea TaxID=248742 RepID=A0ABR2YAW3_9CHLO